jgi:hypothetical protein
MRALKKYLIGAVVGLLVGLWFGVNIGEGRPVWANPFAKKDLVEKAKDVASEAVKDAKKAAIKKLEE